MDAKKGYIETGGDWLRNNMARVRKPGFKTHSAHRGNLTILSLGPDVAEKKGGENL